MSATGTTALRPRLLGRATVNAVVAISVLYTLLPVLWLVLAAAKNRDALFGEPAVPLRGIVAGVPEARPSRQHKLHRRQPVVDRRRCLQGRGNNHDCTPASQQAGPRTQIHAGRQPAVSAASHHVEAQPLCIAPGRSRNR